jgi:hypothetical protein
MGLSLFVKYKLAALKDTIKSLHELRYNKILTENEIHEYQRILFELKTNIEDTEGKELIQKLIDKLHVLNNARYNVSLDLRNAEQYKIALQDVIYYIEKLTKYTDKQKVINAGINLTIIFTVLTIIGLLSASVHKLYSDNKNNKNNKNNKK